MYTFPTTTVANDYADDVDPACPTFSPVGLPDDVGPSLARAAALDAARECDAADAQADWDATHCTCCGAESSGISFVGIRVPMCDRCVIAELVGRVGCGHVRDVISSIGASFAA
jgi:hypothetical protein